MCVCVCVEYWQALMCVCVCVEYWQALMCVWGRVPLICRASTTKGSKRSKLLVRKRRELIEGESPKGFVELLLLIING